MCWQVPKLPQELQPERSLGAERDYFRFMQDALLHVGVIDKDRCEESEAVTGCEQLASR